MGYESKLVIVEGSCLGPEDPHGKTYANVIAIIDLCKTGACGNFGEVLQNPAHFLKNIP